MNRIRRKDMSKALELLDQAKVLELLGQAKDIIEACRDEEQEAYDNLPEGIQSSDRGELMDGYIYEMEDAMESIESAMESIASAVDTLTDNVIEA